MSPILVLYLEPVLFPSSPAHAHPQACHYPLNKPFLLFLAIVLLCLIHFFILGHENLETSTGILETLSIACNHWQRAWGLYKSTRYGNVTYTEALGHHRKAP